ncbi:hypothetical protein MESS4_280107 [Mesorhizobium sp. STM 4661]|nr:hypothetical protein MESS4_280107 [Mesorhizobium sp. STM 4661]
MTQRKQPAPNENRHEIETGVLFLATVWIVSSLRVNRLKALWRVGFGLKKDARPLRQLAAERTEGPRRNGGLRSGAGTSGVSRSMTHI